MREAQLITGASPRRGGRKRNSSVRRFLDRINSSDTEEPQQQQQQQSNQNNKEEEEDPNQILKQQLLPILSSAASAALSFLARNDLLLLPCHSLSIESHLSSISHSLSSLFSLLHIPRPPTTPLPALPSPSQCWFRRFLSIASDADSRWIDTFRMSKNSFSVLLGILAPSLRNSFPSVPPDYVLAAALFRLAHGAPYGAVSRRFGLDSSATCRAFFLVCKLVNEKLVRLFEFRSDRDKIVMGFGWMLLPNCCGVLGMRRFSVDCDTLEEDGALMVQALVDAEGRFLDVAAGWPSTMSPDEVLRKSYLFSRVEESKELSNGRNYGFYDGISVPHYILGDSCFPLLPWLLTPFDSEGGVSPLNDSEKAFNYMHSRGMALVGRAFGRLRVVWRLLSKTWKEECLEYFPFVAVTCCLLHNYLIKCKEPLLEGLVSSMDEQKLPVYKGEESESGKQMRDALALHLTQSDDEHC